MILRGADLSRALRHEPALCDAFGLCERLGLIGGPGTFARQAGGGLLIRCPWHEDHTPSCSVRRGTDETLAVRCHGCGATGDALSLIAAAERWSVKQDFPRVLQRAAEIAGRFDLGAERGSVATAPTPEPPQPAPEREYPELGQVIDVWSSAGYVADDEEAAVMLAARGLDPEAIDDRALARVIRADARLPSWARFRGRSWATTGHRLILPTYDHAGRMRSLRAWRVTDDASLPKRLPPGGHRAAGLVLADAFAVAMLYAGRRIQGMSDPLRVVIVEGEPDFLTWATRYSDADEDAPVILGVGSGAWSEALAARIPDRSIVAIRTDHDSAGNGYALDVWSSLRARCAVRRATHPVSSE